MKRTLAFLFAAAFPALLNAPRLDAQTDLYNFPRIEDEEIAKKKREEARPDQPFAIVLAKKTGAAQDKLSEALDRGFGRTELIRLVLISQKSKKPLEDLIKQREKGERMAKIAEQNGADNSAIRKQANAMLKELEKEEERVRKEAAKKAKEPKVKPTTAGVEKDTKP